MLKTILFYAAISVVIYFGGALLMIASQSPSDFVFEEQEAGSIEFSAALQADYSGIPDLTKFSARDGAQLGYRFYPSKSGSDRVIVLVHGSSWHGMQFHKMAKAFSDAGLGDVVLPDLRGHGPDAVTRGNIAHIGQLEEDMADLITHIKGRANQEKEVVLGGHSSGGGFVVRFASGEYGALADRLVLMAPYLQHDAPTTRPNSGNWAFPALRRIIGLSMLNNVGITALNHLPIIKFNMPASVRDNGMGHTATLEYSYALNTGFSPRRNYKGDLARIAQPLLLLVGSEDESFFAEKYEPLMSPHVKNGTYQIVPKLNHFGVVFADQAIEEIATWINPDQ